MVSYRDTYRELDLSVTFEVWIDGTKRYESEYGNDHITRYSTNSSISNGGFPIGSVASRNFTLEMTDIDIQGYSDFSPTIKVAVDMGLKQEDGTIVYTPFGRWIVDSIEMREQGQEWSIQGHDALYSGLSDRLSSCEPEVYTGKDIVEICDVAATIAGVDFDPEDYPIYISDGVSSNDDTEDYEIDPEDPDDPGSDPGSDPEDPEDDPLPTNEVFREVINRRVTIDNSGETDPDNTTWRDFLSTALTICGAYAFITFDGTLKLRSVYCGNKHTAIDPSLYNTLNVNRQCTFEYNRMLVQFKDSEGEPQEKYTAIDTTEYPVVFKSNDARDTVQVPFNVLNYESNYKNLHNGFSLVRKRTVDGEIAWCGDPGVELGDFIPITPFELDGTLGMLVTADNYTFDGGLTCTLSCDMMLDIDHSDTFDPEVLADLTRPSWEHVTITTPPIENISASSEYSDRYGIENAFDGKGSTSWASAKTDPNPYIIINLGGNYRNIAVSIYSRKNVNGGAPSKVNGELANNSSFDNPYSSVIYITDENTSACKLLAKVEFDTRNTYRWLKLNFTHGRREPYTAIGYIVIEGDRQIVGQ